MIPDFTNYYITCQQRNDMTCVYKLILKIKQMQILYYKYLTGYINNKIS